MASGQGRGRPAPFFSTVRGTLVLLLLIVLVPVILAQVGLSLSNYYARLAQEAQAQLDVARVVAVAFDSDIHDILHQETVIGTALTASPPPTPAEVDRILVTGASQYPSLLRINWTDPQGRVIASSDPRAVGLNVSDRPDVQAVQQGQEVAVSNLLLSRVEGIPIFAIARGIRDPQGNLLGIVVAVADPAMLGKLALPVVQSRGAAIAIFDHRGQLIYRRPEVYLTIEQRQWLGVLPQLSRALAGQEATGTFASPVDGQNRVFALAPVPDIGWAAMADRPLAQITAPLMEALLVQLGLLLGIGGLGLAIALLGSRRITHPLARLQAHDLAVGRGEPAPPVPPSGPSELQALAEASNLMAAEIREREDQVARLLEAERRAHTEAEAAVRARDEFLAGAAHELKTPVTNLRGFAELALRRLDREGMPGAQRLRHILETFDQQSERLANLIAELLDVAAVEAGELELRRQETDLVSLTQEVVAREQARSGREIRLTHAPGPLPAMIDRERIALVLTNLLDNAVKFSPKGRPIEVEITLTDPEHVRIAVRDWGPGIPPERRALLFTRFYQAQAGRPFSGVGLGLYFSRCIVELHGGHIKAEFPEDGGSRFIITLPL